MPQPHPLQTFLAVLLTAIGLGPYTTASAAEATAPARPNIVVLLCDDFRWDAFGAAGNRVIQTPNLDRLAAEGVMFTDCFVTASICYSARASLFTGQYERRHGVRAFGQTFSTEQWAQTYPGLLRSAGYLSAFVGKLGVGDLNRSAQEFDYWKGVRDNGPFFDPNDPTRTHSTARYGSQAIEFLRTAGREKPFVLSVSFDAPHAEDGRPREYPPDPRDESLYADVTVPVPELATDAAYQRLPEFVRNSEGRRRWSRRFATPEMSQSVMKDYYRLITGIDREIGRVRAALTELGLATNTVVIFMSDNGYQLGDRGMADKWLPYEQSMRIPLVIHDPRLPASSRGRKVAAQVLNIDLAPTLVALAGLTAPARMQGRSLLSWIEGRPPADWRTEFFYEYINSSGNIPSSEAVRTDRWKYIRWIGQNPVVEELFDLQADPLEQRNLAAAPEQAATLAKMRERWTALAEQVK